MAVNLTHIPMKSIMMNVVVEDILPMFRTLLSRSWEAKMGGTLQMDMSYASIHVFGETMSLYWEIQMKYVVSSKEEPENHPIYAVDTNLGLAILYNDLNLEEENQQQVEDQVQIENEQVTNIDET